MSIAVFLQRSWVQIPVKPSEGFVIFSLMQKIALRIMRPYTIDIEVVIM